MRRFQIGTTNYIKSSELRDTEGRKITNKIRCDVHGLYIKRHGWIGRVETRVKVSDIGSEIRCITTTRQVKFYESMPCR